MKTQFRQVLYVDTPSCPHGEEYGSLAVCGFTRLRISRILQVMDLCKKTPDFAGVELTDVFSVLSNPVTVAGSKHVAVVMSNDAKRVCKGYGDFPFSELDGGEMDMSEDTDIHRICVTSTDAQLVYRIRHADPEMVCECSPIPREELQRWLDEVLE